VQPGVVEPDRSAYTQLEIYEGLLRAFDRRAEVLDAIASAPDRDAAVLRVRDLLEVTHLQATAILDLQLHRFAAGARDRISHRAAELRHALIG
jgi:DNA gyrase/topoisomerase IV subunit A